MYHTLWRVEYLVVALAVLIAILLLWPTQHFAQGFFDVRPVYAYASKNSATILLWNASDKNIDTNITLNGKPCLTTNLLAYTITYVACPVDENPPGTEEKYLLCIQKVCSPIPLVFT